MSTAVINRLFSNLDMVSLNNKKYRGKLFKSVIVYVNSALFLSNSSYSLQIRNVKYEQEGMVNKAWEYIEEGKYIEAEKLFDSILTISDNLERAYFGKFIVSIFQGKDAYIYLKRTIETRSNDKDDDYYRLYLNLYNVFLDIEEDYIPLLELLRGPKKIIAFSKKSYNGQFLELINNITSKEYARAKENLSKCLEMKDSIYLKVLMYLLDEVLKYLNEMKKAYEKQERELEKKRSIAFANAVKAKDIVSAKKTLEIILSYRNQNDKNNYIYYLFLELIETIEMVSSNPTFEIMPVDYVYKNKTDSFYTFQEAIGIADFKTALEYGRKCRGKALDTKQSVIKVNLYVILLELLFDLLDERVKNIDNLYQLLISNIEQGNYKHALNLYNDNATILKEYNNRLVNYLFKRLIDKSRSELSLEIETEDIPTKITEEVEDISLALDKVEYEEVLEDVVIPSNDEVVEIPEQVINITKPVNSNTTIFLRHNEPNNEFFYKYQLCLVNKNYYEAKTWLDHFAELLEENKINKRLDYYYYQVRLGMYEAKYGEEDLYRRKQVYFYAYNALLEGKYEEAETYLNYYIEEDLENDIRGYLLLGRLYTIIKKPDKAIECYINANAIAPSPDAYYFLGELYFKKHKWADAIFCYLNYNEFYPNESPTVYLNLSECYRRIGKTDKVLKYLKIADEINVTQKRGLNLKDRILKAEMANKKRREHFLLNKGNNSTINN